MNVLSMRHGILENNRDLEPLISPGVHYFNCSLIVNVQITLVESDRCLQTFLTIKFDLINRLDGQFIRYRNH